MERPAKGGTGAIQAYLHDGGLIYSPPPPKPTTPQVGLRAAKTRVVCKGY